METIEAEERLRKSLKAFYFIVMDNQYGEGWRKLDIPLSYRGLSSDDFVNGIMVEIEDNLKDYEFELEIEEDGDISPYYT